jgi:hypothetical protein
MSSISLNSLIKFIKNPYSSDFTYTDSTIKRKLIVFLKLVYIYFLTTAIFIVFLAIEKVILLKFGIKIKNFHIESFFEWKNYYVLLINIFFAPILEELVFRLPLLFRKRNIIIAYFVLLGAIIINLYKIDYKEIRIIISFGLLFLSALPLYFFDKVNDRLLKRIENNYGKYFVYISIILFSCSHLSNIDNFHIKLLPIYLVNLFPIFFAGVCFSFCRLKLGFLYGLLLHIFGNILPALSIIF